MCIYLYIHTYDCTCISVNVRVCICVYVYIYIYIRMRTSVDIYVHTYMYIHFLYILLCVYVYIQRYTCVYMNICGKDCQYHVEPYLRHMILYLCSEPQIRLPQPMTFRIPGGRYPRAGGAPLYELPRFASSGTPEHCAVHLVTLQTYLIMLFYVLSCIILSHIMLYKLLFFCLAALI